MTAKHEHMPSTEHVRFIYSLDGADREYKAQEFDRWHAAEIAAAEQRGKEQGWDEARSDWFQYADAINDTPSKYYPALWLKNRADREGDDA